MTEQAEMTIDDFIFTCFTTGATHILKKLRDKRMKSNRYVSDKRWMSKKHGDKWANEVTCWFNVPIHTDRSLPIETWAEDCEKTGYGWELRQCSETHYTVFLFTNPNWEYNKQIRSFKVQQNQHDELWKTAIKSPFIPGGRLAR